MLSGECHGSAETPPTVGRCPGLLTRAVKGTDRQVPGRFSREADNQYTAISAGSIGGITAFDGSTHINTLEKLEEVAKLRKYLDDAEAILVNVGIIGRSPRFNKFDVIAMALVSKVFSVARACLLLLENGFEDEAYGMSRSVVECAWTLRYLTQAPGEIESRTWKYINYFILDKQFWMYHAMMSATDEETKSHIREHGEELGLHDDPTEVAGHWSGKNGFGWIVSQMEHPLDGPNTNEAIRSAEYAVDYHQTSAFVHCYEPAIENFVPAERTPFKVKRADGDGGQPGQSVLFILLRYIHASMAYLFFGFGLERPRRLNELFSKTLNEDLQPVPRRVQPREKEESALEDLPQLRPWLTWTELTGSPRDTPGKRKALADLIRQYPREDILRACSTLSVLFGFGPEGNTTADNSLTAAWIPPLFHPSLVERVKAFAADKRVIFFQAQLRFLASEVLRVEPDPAKLIANVLPNEAIGELLLRSGEMLYKPYVKQPDPMDELANRAALFLPFYEIDSQHDPAAFFLRAYIYLTIIIPMLPASVQTFTIPEMFEAKYKFSLTEYCEFIFMFFMQAMMARGKKSLDVAINSGLHVGLFKNTTWPHASIERMFNSVSFTLDQLTAVRPEIGFADFDYLRAQPYFRLGNQLFCLDYEFAVNKIESTIIWGLLRELKTDGDKDAFLGYWGHVFEYYVGWLFQTYAIAAFNTVHVAPKYADDSNNEICDVIVTCGKTAVLIEAKLATCPSKTRYAGDYKKMKSFLEEKLVNDVGVDQLVKAVSVITTDPKKTSEKVPVIPDLFEKIDTIIPVIVTRDDIGSSWSVNAYLNNRFSERLLGKKRHKRIRVTPLLSLSVGTLEKLMGTLNKMSLDCVLEDRIKRNPTLLWPFDAASKYVSRGMHRNTPKHMEILHEITDKTIKDFGIIDPPNISK